MERVRLDTEVGGRLDIDLGSVERTWTEVRQGAKDAKASVACKWI